MFIRDAAYFANAGFDQPSQGDEEVGEVCIPNISLKERKKREKFAIQQFIFTLMALVVLLALDVNPLWRLLLFFMFSAATTTYIQSLDKT
jgi:hypothetical protein